MPAIADMRKTCAVSLQNCGNSTWIAFWRMSGLEEDIAGKFLPYLLIFSLMKREA
jgi:hypothetical protein